MVRMSKTVSARLVARKIIYNFILRLRQRNNSRLAKEKVSRKRVQ
jgi:hypothetical protein